VAAAPVGRKEATGVGSGAGRADPARPAPLAPGEGLAGALGQQPLLLRHRLDPADPRFAPVGLARFAASLPPSWVRAQVAPDDALAQGAPSALTPEAAVAGLAGNGHTVRLYHLELHPAWRPLISEVLEAALAGIPGPEARPSARAGGLFLASPGALTPWHPDRHHNLLLQVRGTKRVTIGEFCDPAEAQRQLERTFVRFGAGPTAVPDVVRTHELGPGDGIYIPPFAMHATVVTGTEVSVALSCSWSTAGTEQAVLVHTFNAAWRRRTGRPGRPPGHNPLTDLIKARAMGARLAWAARRRR
jgi:hypothetical protein